MVSSPNEPWHVPALKTCGQCKMKGPDWSEDCSCPITLRVDFVVTRIVGSNADLRFSYFEEQPLREGEGCGSGVLLRRSPLGAGGERPHMCASVATC